MDRISPLICVFLLLDRLEKLELRPASVKVMPLAVHLEISIAGQIIGEKANARFQR